MGKTYRKTNITQALQPQKPEKTKPRMEKEAKREKRTEKPKQEAAIGMTQDDNALYIKSQSDFSKPLTRRRIKRVCKALEESCRGMGYNVVGSEFITEQKYIAESVGNVCSMAWGEDT